MHPYLGALCGGVLIGLAAVLLRMALAGLLVGVGTRLGGGCTSGHGVCGIARLSPRSLLATVVFMLFGIGWGVAGYCSGPALASLVAGAPALLLLLVACMVLGWWLTARLLPVANGTRP